MNKLPAGSKIKLFRILYGFSQEDIRLLTGAKQRMIVTYEKGQARMPRHVTDRISALFSLNAEWILQDVGPVFTREYVLLRLLPPKDRALFTRKRNELIEVLGGLFKTFITGIKMKEVLRAVRDNDVLYLFVSDTPPFFLEVAKGFDISGTLEEILSDAHIRMKDVLAPGGDQLEAAMLEMAKTVATDRGISVKDSVAESVRQWNPRTNALREYEKIQRETRIREVCSLIKQYDISAEEIDKHCRGD